MVAKAGTKRRCGAPRSGSVFSHTQARRRCRAAASSSPARARLRGLDVHGEGTPGRQTRSRLGLQGPDLFTYIAGTGAPVHANGHEAVPTRLNADVRGSEASIVIELDSGDIMPGQIEPGDQSHRAANSCATRAQRSPARQFDAGDATGPFPFIDPDDASIVDDR